MRRQNATTLGIALLCPSASTRGIAFVTQIIRDHASLPNERNSTCTPYANRANGTKDFKTQRELRPTKKGGESEGKTKRKGSEAQNRQIQALGG